MMQAVSSYGADCGCCLVKERGGKTTIELARSPPVIRSLSWLVHRLLKNRFPVFLAAFIADNDLIAFHGIFHWAIDGQRSDSDWYRTARIILIKKTLLPE